ncbi:MAG: AraC family transcriptional regulator, partial [Firmicutes bacterium]|nr:AraC family transcriptional regulator [Bacillota bacterium]
RFSHLFKEQVGMTFASYVVYQRILYVYYEILRGRSITEAALEAGFCSSSHFADVNRRIFGISASSIIENLEFIKVG